MKVATTFYLCLFSRANGFHINGHGYDGSNAEQLAVTDDEMYQAVRHAKWPCAHAPNKYEPITTQAECKSASEALSYSTGVNTYSTSTSLAWYEHVTPNDADGWPRGCWGMSTSGAISIEWHVGTQTIEDSGLASGGRAPQLTQICAGKGRNDPEKTLPPTPNLVHVTNPRPVVPVVTPTSSPTNPASRPSPFW